jgi:hypothetical protein
LPTGPLFAAAHRLPQVPSQLAALLFSGQEAAALQLFVVRNENLHSGPSLAKLAATRLHGEHTRDAQTNNRYAT